MCVPKCLKIAQFLPNSCLTFPAGMATPKEIQNLEVGLESKIYLQSAF